METPENASIDEATPTARVSAAPAATSEHDRRFDGPAEGRDSSGQASERLDDAGSMSLTDVLERFDEKLDGADSVAFDDIVGAFGTRAFGPLLTLPALLALSPLGAIPGVPAILALCVILVAGQHLVGRDRPWLPSTLRQRSVDAERWDRSYDLVKPWAERIDRLIGPRLTWMTEGVMDRALSGLAIAMAGAMVPLELVPFAVALPASALLLIGLALTACDGVLAIVASVLAAGSIAAIVLML